MKRSHLLWGVILLLAMLAAAPVSAQDMRLNVMQREKQQQELLEKAAAEERAAKKAAEEKQAAIARDKGRLKQAIQNLKKEVAERTATHDTLIRNLSELTEQGKTLESELGELRSLHREFQGYVRANAKDLSTMIVQSPSSALAPHREKFLSPIAEGRRMPTMDDVSQMADLLLALIRSSGEVTRTTAAIVDREGRERDADLLLAGGFTGIYRLDNEIGFLLYSETSQRYFALSQLPSDTVRKNLSQYYEGSRPDVFMDISHGEALRRLTRQLHLTDQIPRGGAIVWPILAILGVAALIVIERLIFFARRRTPVEPLMAEVKERVTRGDFQGLQTLLEARKTRLVPKVLLRALALKDRSRTEMENALQETILGEIPAIERFISTLGMLAAIAPLLGLLGTVTGMINTFHVITSVGTGDPRMMSGGISEALVTTMLGLTVAIPVMLAHTLLSRQVEIQISRMEEKAVAFVNLLCQAGPCGEGNGDTPR